MAIEVPRQGSKSSSRVSRRSVGRLKTTERFRRGIHFDRKEMRMATKMDEPQRKYTSLFSICFHQLVGRLIERFSEAPDRVGESGDSNSRDILLEEILHQLRLLVYDIVYRGFYTSLNGAGFLPTVCPIILPILPRVLDKIFPEMFGIPLGFWISTWSSWFSAICPMANLQKHQALLPREAPANQVTADMLVATKDLPKALSPDTSTNKR